MEPKAIIDRLMAVDPGWDEWSPLVALVRSLVFDYVTSDYMGNFYSAGDRLSFSELRIEQTWPAWLPAYVPALFGMKAENWEMSGGYADAFENKLAQQGAIFSSAGNDDKLGYPPIDLPDDLYVFQTNASGARFFLNKSLVVYYPNAEAECCVELDSLEDFTRKSIQQALAGKPWFDAYIPLNGSLLD